MPGAADPLEVALTTMFAVYFPVPSWSKAWEFTVTVIPTGVPCCTNPLLGDASESSRGRRLRERIRN